MNFLKKLICFALTAALLCACDPGQPEPSAPSTAPTAPTDPSQHSQSGTQPQQWSAPPIPSQTKITDPLPASPDGWVFTNYDQTLTWRDQANNYCAMTLQLPALVPAAEFATTFNARMAGLGEALLQEAELCQRMGYPPSTYSLTYRTLRHGELLFILVDRLFADGITQTDIHCFEPDDLEALRVGDVPEELLDMSYPTFLMAATDLVRQAYIKNHSQTIAELEQQQAASAATWQPHTPDPRIQVYYVTLEKLDSSVFHLSQAYLFMDADGQLLLSCAMPTLEEGVSMPQVLLFDPDALTWEKVPTDAQSYGRLFDLQHYVDGAYADAYATLLLEAFLADPEDFTHVAAGESEYSITQLTGSIAYALAPLDKPLLLAEIAELQAQEDLSGAELAFLRTLLKAVE